VPPRPVRVLDDRRARGRSLREGDRVPDRRHREVLEGLLDLREHFLGSNAFGK